ncbi:hypothetical protein P8452_46870 [Trifolium repens]|nr:hypothetical protein P8452_46870 [Trifolium repens]
MASTSGHRNKKKIKVEEVIDPIIISSDEEVEVPRPPRQPAVRGFQWDWKKEVTPALADLTKKQTLHIPSWVVREYMMHRNNVYVRSVTNGHTYDCTLMKPAERGKAVRYIGDEWYDYLDDHESEVGDLLLFNVSDVRNIMLVKLVRAEERCQRRRR